MQYRTGHCYLIEIFVNNNRTKMFLTKEGAQQKYFKVFSKILQLL